MASNSHAESRILVIAAHPDDEVLGCGGTLACHAIAGSQVVVVFLTDGVGARQSTGDPDSRRRSAERSARILGVDSLHFLDLPDNRCDSVPLLDVIRAVEPIANEFRPNIVYTHCGSDLNVDHRVAHQTALTLFRPVPESDVTEILAFETPSSTEWASHSSLPFRPSVFVDIRTTIEQKRAALLEYGMELRDYPHARSLESIRALSTYRGCSAGLIAAEAFELVRSVRKY